MNVSAPKTYPPFLVIKERRWYRSIQDGEVCKYRDETERRFATIRKPASSSIPWCDNPPGRLLSTLQCQYASASAHRLFHLQGPRRPLRLKIRHRRLSNYFLLFRNQTKWELGIRWYLRESTTAAVYCRFQLRETPLILVSLKENISSDSFSTTW